MPPQPQADPFSEFVVQTDDPFAAFATQVAPPEAPPEQSSGGASATIGGLRTVPSVKRAIGRFAANHPAATQKMIGAGITTAASGAGAAVGGIPGAVVGASIRGVTPAQTVIREAAGRMAGEAPTVARDAARALGIQNYAKETTGLKVKPSDIISKPNAKNALEAYANANEKGILRLYGPSGEVVSGPSAVSRVPVKPKPGMLRAAAGAVGRGLAKVSGPVGMTDFAQAVEPNRRDIGVAGIGASPNPNDFEPINAKNMRHLAEVRAAIMRRLGLQ